MAQNGYFTQFPDINYETANSVDITERVVFANGSLSNPFLFYPYDVVDGERPDQFANRYYGDSFQSWLLYLSNQIIDPYYGWYVSSDCFDKFINLKYGSVISAQAKISHYENNWYSASSISVSDFHALPSTLVKYYEPVFDVRNNISSYNRVQANTSITTNSIVAYGVVSNAFVIDELVNIVFSANASGNGQVMAITSNTLYVQHTSGVTISNVYSSSYIYGQESLTNTNMSYCNTVVNNLLPEEVINYSPVSYYDYESNINENNKTIKVLDSAYSLSAVNTVKKLLNT